MLTQFHMRLIACYITHLFNLESFHFRWLKIKKNLYRFPFLDKAFFQPSVTKLVFSVLLKSVKERPTENNSKPTIGRKLSRVLSIFRKQHQKAEEEAGGGEEGEPIKEPIYEELIYGDISSPQNCLNTYGSVNFKQQIKNSELIEILRLGKPFPQVKIEIYNRTP